jgi:hypothetical protein
MKSKEERNEYARNYYEEHKVEYSFRSALKYEKNKEAIKARTKIWQKNNNEKCKEYRKKYRADKTKCNNYKNYKHNWIDENPLKHFKGTENYFDKNIESHREYANKYTEEHYDEKLEYNKKWVEKNKDYYKVVRETCRLVESGEIIKKPCSVCGEAETKAYHNDRIDPKNIDWLCKEHFWAKKKEFYRERKRIKLGLTSP